jgi:hypothetical protein
MNFIFTKILIQFYFYLKGMFGTNPNKELGINFEKGEVVESDSNEFRPMYPIYKDYSI